MTSTETIADAETITQANWRDRCLSVQREFGWFLATMTDIKPSPVVDQALIRALLESWVRPEDLVVPIARYLAAKWPRALTGTVAAGEPQLLEVVRDPVLIAMLRQTPAATPGLERLLARLRFGALRNVMERRNVEDFMPTLTALAVRGWHSGYALTLPLEPRHAADREREAELVTRLIRELDEGERAGTDLVAGLAVSATYGPPDPKHLNDALQTGHPAMVQLQELIAAPRLRQFEIARSLEPSTSIDPSSREVADQYETHPYPAWIGEPSDVVQVPPEVQAAVGIGGPAAVDSVLVAGCGTGQHAAVAGRAWPSADILAVDISRASLAYAIDRTRDVPENRVTFKLADLLSLHELGRRFQVIEAMGVLHHLADPEEGLEALVKVLEPGGIIGIGLYSAAARAGHSAIRDQFSGENMESDAAVRNFRAWALANLDAPELLYSPDFYSIGGCRDAFFHVREHCYSLEEIGRMIDRAGLRLLAIQAPPLAAERLSIIPGPTDIAGWAAAEQANPDLFLGMYEIWAQA